MGAQLASEVDLWHRTEARVNRTADQRGVREGEYSHSDHSCDEERILDLHDDLSDQIEKQC